MHIPIKYFGNINLQQNTISNVVIGSKTSSQQLSSIKGEIFFIDGDVSNLYTSNGSSIFKIGSKIRISELSNANANVNMNGYSFSNVAYPSNSTDVATKSYVLDVAFGNVASFDLKNANVEFSQTTYSIDSNLTHEENMRVIDSAIYSIIPSPPLMSNTTITSDVTLYSAKLSNGLGSYWYTDANANSLVTGYTRYSNARVYFDYLSGINSQIKTYGNLYLNINGTDSPNVISLKNGDTYFKYETLRLDANVIISNNSYYNYWNNVNVRTDITFNTSGYSNLIYKSTKTGDSPQINFYYDDVATAPTFSSSPTNSVNTSNVKYLSNVLHYANSSSFYLSFVGASGIFEKAYHPNAVALINMTSNATTQFGINPNSTPEYNDTFIVSNHLVTINNINVSSGQSNGLIYVTLQKPDNQTITLTTDIGGKINTYGNVSTNTIEYFLDEAYRLESNVLADISWSSLGSFDSSNTGVDAQVRNGYLRYPFTSDYHASYAPTGTKEYHRRFYPGEATNSGYLEFEGIDVNNISAYGSGSVNGIIYLTETNKYFDIGKDVCFTCNGNSLANAYPARDGIINSNVINYTLETFSTGLESTNSFRLILYFRDSVETISKISHFIDYNS